jgi:hypothetical protein
MSGPRGAVGDRNRSPDSHPSESFLHPSIAALGGCRGHVSGVRPLRLMRSLSQTGVIAMFKRQRTTIVHVLWLLSVAPVCAGDFYVVTATFPSQGVAQTEAALRGGWVLDTDFYSNLTPNTFAVVRGPFTDESVARKELRFLLSGGGYSGGYVKDAGKPRLGGNLGSAPLRPQLLAALLGELSVEVRDHPGGENPCEPQEPYQEVQISFVDLTRKLSDSSNKVQEGTTRRDVDVGAFRIIKRTGEIDRMRQCFE